MRKKVKFFEEEGEKYDASYTTGNEGFVNKVLFRESGEIKATQEPLKPILKPDFIRTCSEYSLL